MKTSITTLLLVVLIFWEAECKGGSFGRSLFSRGSFSRSSPSYSNPSYSRPSPSYPSPSHSFSSYSHSRPSPSYSKLAPAYTPSGSSFPSYSPAGNTFGRNGNTKPGTSGTSNSKPNQIGSNVKNQPVGPPPAYPGHANKPVSNHNAPPAYSPSYSNPPAYNPQPIYGSTFGSAGLGGNTYISNNYYRSPYRSGGGGSPFLTNALFFGAGMHSGYMWGSHSSSRRSWSSSDDRRWRSTTKAPYFENKVPGSESVLPAAAVVGAATAFGLVSLLPLNVPSQKPLMYCNVTEITQTNIQIDFDQYSCLNGSISMYCPRTLDNSTVIDECLNKTMQCDVAEDSSNLFCTNATLVSRVALVCNSTTVLNGTNVNETTTILNCYEGYLNEKLASSIPTTTMRTTTEALVGEIEDLGLSENETAWVAEAMTIPPSTSETRNSSSYFEWLASRTTTKPPETTTYTSTSVLTTEETATFPPSFIKSWRKLTIGTIIETMDEVPDTLGSDDMMRGEHVEDTFQC